MDSKTPHGPKPAPSYGAVGDAHSLLDQLSRHHRTPSRVYVANFVLHVAEDGVRQGKAEVRPGDRRLRVALAKTRPSWRR